MSAAAQQPQPKKKKGAEQGGQSQHKYALSTSAWDPGFPAFDHDQVDAISRAILQLSEHAASVRSQLEARGQTLDIVDASQIVDVPDNWAQSKGSPVHYLRVAEGYLSAAALGTVCRMEHPPVVRSESPPPANRWCCTHTPPHCQP